MLHIMKNYLAPLIAYISHSFIVRLVDLSGEVPGIFVSGLIFLDLTFSNGDMISLVLSLNCFLQGVRFNDLHASG